MFEIGDIAACIRPVRGHLTIGKEYVVLGVISNQYDEHFVRVVDDDGDPGGWLMDRFIHVIKKYDPTQQGDREDDI